VKLYLSEHFHKKIRQHAIFIAGTTLHLLIYRTFSSYFAKYCNFVLLLCAEKTVNKQAYIHTSYHVAEMEIFEYY